MAYESRTILTKIVKSSNPMTAFLESVYSSLNIHTHTHTHTHTRTYIYTQRYMDFPSDSDGKKSACNAGDPGSIPGLGRSLGERNGYTFSILAWRIPWTQEPSRLQSMRLQSWT